MNKSSADQPIANILKFWQVTPRRDPDFRSQVWQRIEAKRRDPQFLSYLKTHAFTAASLCLLAVVVGGWSGRTQAQHQAHEQREALISAYVQSLDAMSQANQ